MIFPLPLRTYYFIHFVINATFKRSRLLLPGIDWDLKLRFRDQFHGSFEVFFELRQQPRSVRRGDESDLR